jgi:hypothetical protein
MDGLGPVSVALEIFGNDPVIILARHGKPCAFQRFQPVSKFGLPIVQK